MVKEALQGEKKMMPTYTKGNGKLIFHGENSESIKLGLKLKKGKPGRKNKWI